MTGQLRVDCAAQHAVRRGRNSSAAQHSAATADQTARSRLLTGQEVELDRPSVLRREVVDGRPRLIVPFCPAVHPQGRPLRTAAL